MLRVFFVPLEFRKSLASRPNTSPERKEQKKWINIPHALVLICDVVIIVVAVQVWYEVSKILQSLIDYSRRGSTVSGTFRTQERDNNRQAGNIYTNDILKVQVEKTYHVKLNP